jgi:hypothetical protein
MQFACRQLSLRTISEQYGVKSENNAFLDMMDPDNEESQQSGSFYANFYRYTTVDVINKRLNDGWPICGFTNKQATNSVFIVYGNSRSKIEYVRLDVDKNEQALTCGGMNYFSFAIDLNLLGHLSSNSSILCVTDIAFFYHIFSLIEQVPFR